MGQYGLVIVVDKSTTMAVNSYAHLGLSKLLNYMNFFAGSADSAAEPGPFYRR